MAPGGGGEAGGEGMTPPLFCVAKRKKGGKGKKERVSKQKLLKGCHQGQNIIVLAILERLESKNPPPLKSVSPDLICFVQDCNFSLEHLRTTNFEHSYIDS